MALRYCRICGPTKPKINDQFHEMDAWPEACYGHFVSKAERGSFQIIRDIDPYKAVAVDSRTGKAPRIGSRREHREFLKANNYVEVGNEPIRERPIIDVPDSHADIARTIHTMKETGRWK